MSLGTPPRKVSRIRYSGYGCWMLLGPTLMFSFFTFPAWKIGKDGLGLTKLEFEGLRVGFGGTLFTMVRKDEHSLDVVQNSWVVFM